ncbi:MAG: geranylgeranyl diphosphate synthase, type [Frankiaceae bacterium]|jgi:geranylgeranyl diphosphate synthase type I|nr:geranylgeranyl diphosphate synthase, type [Frankiaceae bacterium]
MVPTSPLDVADLGDRVHKSLEAFLGRQAATLDAIAEDLGPVADALTGFLLDGGKRLRPAFCYWGWRGAGGADTDEIVTAASCLELLHACALIHDDVMDGSDTRRGKPAVHRRFAMLHRGEEWLGDAESFGRSAAILLGDLCLIWADQMFNESGLPGDARLRAAPTYDAMRGELMAGQYLDLLEQVLGGRDVDRALRVARYKSAKYTIERPLHLGGILAGATPQALDAYTAYGLPLGEAFQLRDDVLGVFGDPAQTGKPAGDDLREGKRTVLIATAVTRASAGQAAVVRRLLGDPGLDDAGVQRLREVIAETGALDHVERLVEERTAEATAALAGAPIEDDARGVLAALAQAATRRRG